MADDDEDFFLDLRDEMFALDLSAEQYTYAEALQDVAKMNGLLSWAVLELGQGPPRLVKCGQKEDELPKAIDATSSSFGLVRMVVGKPPGEQTVFVYFQFQRRGYEPAMVLPNKFMEEVIEKYASNIMVKLNIDAVDEMNPDRVWRELFNPEYGEAEHHADVLAKPDSEDQGFFDKLKARNDNWADSDDGDVVSQPVSFLNNEEGSGSIELTGVAARASQEGKVEYAEWDSVMVYSRKKEIWYEDGTVIRKLEDMQTLDGLANLPAGSIQVTFNNNKSFKWVTPNLLRHLVRHSSRPRPPDQVNGDLYKRTNVKVLSVNCSFLGVWHSRYVELRAGFLEWWADRDEVQAGLGAKGLIYLYDMQLERDGTSLTMMTGTPKTGKGMVKTTYSFDATTPEGAEDWFGHLNKHSEYCIKMQAYLKSEEHEEFVT